MSLTRYPTLSIARDVLRLAKTVRTAETRHIPGTHRVFWTCRECRGSTVFGGRTARDGAQRHRVPQRQFSSTARHQDERPSEARRSIEPITSTSPTNSEPHTPASSLSSLPSHTANRRSDISKQASKILDTLLARASVASQHINAYTGTDYSGIEALRKEIIEHEQKVRTLHSTVDEAKAKHHDAYAKQTSAQREIVGLLERKSSWSPSDLERYMSLVRSEHLNDQDVQGAKDNLTVAERELEETRSLLEKLERKQYHEEQIWSDTIRRNSTWVTFGLMGVNILLLLAQIAIFEPYRRKKIVKDVKSALDEKALTAAPSVTDTERQVDAAIPPENVTLEEAEEQLKQPLDAFIPVTEKNAGTTMLSSGEVLPADAADVAGSDSTNRVQPGQTPGQISPQLSSGNEIPNSTWSKCQEAIRDLFSERLVQMRKVDVTITALQGAATGVAIMSFLFVLLRPK